MPEPSGLHIHNVADIDGFPEALDGKADRVDVYTKAEVDALLAGQPGLTGLLYSMSADRSNPQGLGQATISGAVYIFLEDSTSGPVEFWLDGVLSQTENTAPWDFAGGSVDSANSWTPSPGDHTVEAKVGGSVLADAGFRSPVVTIPPSPSNGFGAGASGAILAVPAGAVTATPSTLESLINSNPIGTDFALQPGVYEGAFPNKTGNGYYGDPDHTKVVFDGQATYPNLNDSTTSDGGAVEAMPGVNNMVMANMTIQKYRGELGKQGPGPVKLNAKSGWLFRNILFQYMERAGFRVAGTDGEVRFCTSRYNGRYGFTGAGRDIHFWNCEAYHCSDATQKAQGQIPRFASSDSGISKFVHSVRLQHHSCYYHDIDHPTPKGLWWDINNREMLMEDCLIENIQNKGLHVELSHGPSIIRRNVIRNCMTSDSHSSIWWASGSAHLNVCGPITFEDNQVVGATDGQSKNGIIINQNDRDYRLGDQASTPENWSAMCGSIIRNNTVSGDFKKASIGVHCSYTKDGCNFFDDPSSITIANNTVLGIPTYYRNGSVTASQWASVGYS